MKGDASGAVTTAGQVARAPFHARPQDYRLAAALAVGVIAASSLDRTVRVEMQRWDDGWLETVDDIGWFGGRAYTNLGTGGLLYLTGLATNESSVRRTGLEVVEAFLLAQVGTQTAKHLLGRYRPYNERGPFRFHGPSLANRYLSFPSGDVTNVVTLTTVLAEEIDRPWATVLLYSFAGMTVFERMHDDRHWFSDTMGAALWSTAAARAVVLANRRQREGMSAFSLSPIFGGCRLTVAF